jgi:polysaccharide export outer membrane protein
MLMTITNSVRYLFAAALIASDPSGFGQGLVQADFRDPALTPRFIAPPVESPEEYLLGPDDQIKIWARGMEEIPATPQRIDPAGYVDLPLLGRIRASGLSLDQFKEALLTALAKEVRKPQVSVEIVEFGSQPVAVVGAVNTPGVHQLHNRKTLAEVLSMAGGLRNDAGTVIKITRLASWGPIPLPGAILDPTGQYNVAEVGVKDLLGAKDPAQNILIRPNDVLTVPVAEMVYVIGAVRKPGGFALTERGGISALQALSMAEGLGPTPAPGNSKILRTQPGASGPTEIAVDLKKMMAGHAEDVKLRPNDVLIVPSSAPKKAGVRALGPPYKRPREWSFGVTRRVKSRGRSGRLFLSF